MIPDFSDPQMLNRYSYVRNNPLFYTDPTGHEEKSANESDGKDKGQNPSESGVKSEDPANKPPVEKEQENLASLAKKAELEAYASPSVTIASVVSGFFGTIGTFFGTIATIAHGVIVGKRGVDTVKQAQETREKNEGNFYNSWQAIEE